MRFKKNVKATIRSALTLLPDKGSKIQDIRWKFYFKMKSVIRRAGFLSSHHFLPDPEAIYWINPKSIEYVTARQEDLPKVDKGIQPPLFDNIKDQGKVCRGDWDISGLRFDELDIYKAFQGRINKKIKWEETDFYKYVTKQIEIGDFQFNCKSKSDLDRRCAYLDLLIQSIQEKGYLISKDVSIEGLNKPYFEEKSEIVCNLGRDGQFLFQDGRHRLAIAKILGLDRIPVKIVVRHSQWQELRDDLIALARKQDGLLYQPALHVDLQDIPSYHLCEDRFLVIRNHIDCNYGSVLDLGANLFFFCHKFEELDFKCVGVELNPVFAKLADKIRVSAKKNFQIVEGDLLGLMSNVNVTHKKFDIVLAFNIFHHFLKTKKDYIRLKEFLKFLSERMTTMFFEPHNPNEEQMSTSYCNFNEEEFVNFIMENCFFVRAECIYETDDKRKIYKLSR